MRNKTEKVVSYELRKLMLELADEFNLDVVDYDYDTIRKIEKLICEFVEIEKMKKYMNK